ncbi:MAG TPA: tRNA (adenosine(37)-N6)-threonylcarbamoyltransferase complex ATPase subunit type 1 TsaE [Pseudogracilibacillus sp.]|nr:tRNA (adenosine(37)-N6)-threonylcarbamoyltransferase complex ATPase subunit type 1 TsaE [Pseudogracilibacillus sp.]
MKTYQYSTKNAEATMQFAEDLAGCVKAGTVITLEGDLGAGKTTFTKGFAKGLGIKRAVSSPTFTIIKEYQGRLPLYHMDAYRLEHSEEDMGFEEYFESAGISIIEWASFISDFLPEERLDINIQKITDTERVLQITAKGTWYEDLLKRLTGIKGD